MKMCAKLATVGQKGRPTIAQKWLTEYVSRVGPNVIINWNNVEYNSTHSDGAMQNPNGKDSFGSTAIGMEWT
jgi:hypothetical protein